jgi:replicative DNA helicase
LHIQKFVEMDDDNGPGWGSNWKQLPPQDSGGGNDGAKLFIQAGSKMNDMPFGDDEEAPF